MNFYQHILPHGTKQYAQWGETLGISLAAFYLSYIILPDDPINTQGYPWLWIAPTLIALRYGVLLGIVSVLVFLAGWLLWASGSSISDAEFPRLTFLGGTLMVMVCGEFSGVWISRTRRIEELQHYTEQRLEMLTRRLYLLSLSHDRLEQDLIGRPGSLREGLKVLNRILPEAHGLAGAELYMALVVRQCNLSVAGLHAVRDRKISAEPEASIGTFTPINEEDPLISNCLQNGELVHINTAEKLSELSSKYLVAVPAKTSDGRIVAILAVEKMPFFALQSENMQTLSVLSSYYADTIAASVYTPYLTEELKDCPIDFFKAMYTLRRLQRDMQISSMVVGFAVKSNHESTEQLKLIANAVRGLDETWTLVRNEWRICLVILPLSGDSALGGYLDRIERNYVERFGLRPGQCGILIRSITLDLDPISKKLDDFIVDLTHIHVTQ